MSATYIQNGWPVSPYSAKTRAYLKYKQIPFEERQPTAIDLARRIRKAVGAAIMPTIETPEGEWLQDSSDIIDALEVRFPERSVTPPGATQRVASLLLELHGDEWLPLPAMHYRWNRDENRRFAIDEFGRYGLPFLPLPIARVLAKPISDKMRSYRPFLGVTPETIPGVERFTEALIAQLDAHLAEHDFMLGSRPCIGDFALFGPLWAHLYRDPGSTYLFSAAPNVRAWFERLVSPSGEAGEFLPGDEVPETLDPVFRTLFAEQFEFVRVLISKIDAYCDGHPDATRVPRALGTHAFAVGGVEGTRKLITFSQWMAQRPIDAYQATEGDTRARVNAWLARVGGEALATQRVAHPMERRAFEMRLR